MWQRIQTIFLVLVVISMIVGIFFPIWVGVDAGVTHKLYPLHYSMYSGSETSLAPNYFPYALTAILMIAAATLAIMEIRRYDDRILQIKMGTLNSLILMGVMVCVMWFANTMINAHPANWTYGYGLYIPFVGVTCNWLAVRFIRRDEKMVRNSDRLR